MRFPLTLLLVVLGLTTVSASRVLAADGQTKTGPIKSVDAAAKTFEVTLPARPLTFTVTDKTVIMLDGKESTFDAAIKPERQVTVTYAKLGDDRVASRVEVKSEKKPAADGMTKTGPIKSVDAAAKTFEVTLPARPLTFTVTDKTVIMLDGKESTFDAAIKPERQVTVTYAKVGDNRVASKVEVKSEKK